MSLSQELSHEN